ASAATAPEKSQRNPAYVHVVRKARRIPCRIRQCRETGRSAASPENGAPAGAPATTVPHRAALQPANSEAIRSPPGRVYLWRSLSRIALRCERPRGTLVWTGERVDRRQVWLG